MQLPKPAQHPRSLPHVQQPLDVRFLKHAQLAMRAELLGDVLGACCWSCSKDKGPGALMGSTAGVETTVMLASMSGVRPDCCVTGCRGGLRGSVAVAAGTTATAALEGTWLPQAASSRVVAGVLCAAYCRACCRTAVAMTAAAMSQIIAQPICAGRAMPRLMSMISPQLQQHKGQANT
jgi:hypothetical protein